MAKTWAEVLASPEFATLGAEQQEEARNQYFQTMVMPAVPADDLLKVRQQFDNDTKPSMQGKAWDVVKDVGLSIWNALPSSKDRYARDARDDVRANAVAREMHESQLQPRELPPDAQFDPDTGKYSLPGRAQDFVRDVAGAVVDLPQNTLASVEAMRASQPGDVVSSTALREDRQRAAAPRDFVLRYGLGLDSADVESAGKSLPFSVISAGAYLPGLAAGAASAPVTGPAAPIIAHGAGMAGAGSAAYRMDRGQVWNQLYGATNKRFKKATGRDMTAEEFTAFAEQPEIAGEVTKHATAEAGFEALGNFVFSKTFGKLLGRSVIQATASDAARAIAEKGTAAWAKAGALDLAGELATETPTQIAQGQAETALGLRAGPAPEWTSRRDWRDAFAEVSWPTVLTVGAMGGAAKAASLPLDTYASKTLADKINAFVAKNGHTLADNEQLSGLYERAKALAEQRPEDAGLSEAVKRLQDEKLARIAVGTFEVKPGQDAADAERTGAQTASISANELLGTPENAHGATGQPDAEVAAPSRAPAGPDLGGGQADAVAQRDGALGAERGPDAAGSNVAGGVVPAPAGTAGRGSRVAAEPSAPVFTHIPGREGVAATERGTEIGYRYTLVDADQLHTSQRDDLSPNPDYPADLQPRDRQRATSEVQISRIANDLRPQRLGESPTVSEGAPIIGNDGAVESGNGRTIALRRAYAAGKAKGYYDWLETNAGHFGFTPQQVAQMRAPVLVRLRTTPVDRVEFARQANESSALQLSPSEQARIDADRIGNLADLAVGENGDMPVSANRLFFTRFLSQVASPNEQANLVTQDGQLSQAGYARIRNAIFARAYGNADLIARVSESLDNNVRNVTNGLLRAAPAMADLRDQVAAGALHPFDIAPVLAKAVVEFSRLRAEGVTVRQALAQQGMFGEQWTPEEVAILEVLDQNSRSAKRIADLLGKYADQVKAMGNPKQGGLFGESQELPSNERVIRSAAEQVRKENDLPGTQGLFDQPVQGVQLDAGGGQQPAASGARVLPAGAARADAGNQRAGGPDQGKPAAPEGAASNGRGYAQRELTPLQKEALAVEEKLKKKPAKKPKTPPAAAGVSVSGNHEFVHAPGGGIDFGEIKREMAEAMHRQPGKIRLQRGVQNADGTGYGLVHIEANHGKQIRGAGFGSVEEFVAHVARDFSQVWQATGPQLLAAFRDGEQHMMYVQLEPAKDESGDYYRVNSAFPVRQEDYPQRHGFKKLWDGSEPASAVTGEQPAFAGRPEESSGQATPNARGQSGASIGTFGAENKVFTEERAAKARALLKKKIGPGTLNANPVFDPEMIQAGIELAGYYVEGGAHKFKDYAQKMLADLGEMARPYLRSWYEAVRHDPAMAEVAEKMSTPLQTDAAWMMVKNGKVTVEPKAGGLADELRRGQEAFDDAPVDAAAHEAATSPQNDKPEPTQAQKEAGNYALGHIRIAGLDISIENPEGSVRSGTDANGKAWENTLHSHYGYLRGTVGKDKDHIDVFIKPGTAEDYAGPLFVIDQKKPGNGHFDEHKVMLGWDTEQQAEEAYKANYSKGWDGVRAITKTGLAEFRRWLDDGDTTQPFSGVQNLDTKQAGLSDAALKVTEQADAIEPAPPAPAVELITRKQQLQAVGQVARIQDFGEKIGGARKDTATPTGSRHARQGSDERPGWMRRYHAMQDTKSGKWFVAKETGGTKGAVQRVGRSAFDSEAEAEAAIPLVEVSRNHRVYSYEDGGKREWGIYRQITDRKRALVKGGFDSHEAAMRYMAEHPAEIIEHKFEFPERPWLDRIKRIGPERRTGDVTTAMFQETFGFRGGEFGNWNMGGDGQAALNHAYDALLDLADAIGVPPKAISLNGELAMAFGARGTGGKNSSAAHYEPGRAVINLTKIKGAGSAAHEWWHAADHYFAKPGDRGTSVVASGFGHAPKARSELVAAFKRVVDTINYAERSKTTDADLVRGRAERRMDEALKSLDHHLNDLRRPYSPKRAFTEDEAKRWDAMVGKLRAGDAGPEVYVENPSKMRGAIGFNIGEHIRDLNAIFKAVTGRSFLRSDPASIGRQMEWIVKAIAENKARLDTKEAVTTTTKGRSDFYIEAKRIDGYRSGDYWSTPEEMGARAFESYIFDKLTADQKRSDYLVYGVENRFYSALDMKPYPEGAERQAIDEAFDNLFHTIQTRETDKGVALFSRLSQTAPDTGQRIHMEDLNAVAAKFRAAFIGLPVHVLEKEGQAPKALLDDAKAMNARGDWAAALHNGEVYLLKTGLRDVAHAEESGIHEAEHAGLERMFGIQLDAVMLDIHRSNLGVQAAALLLKQKYQYSTVRATNEVLAEMGPRAKKLKAWDRLVAAVRDILRHTGLVKAWTDNDVEALVLRALAAAKKPAKTHIASGTAFSKAEGGTDGNNPRNNLEFAQSVLSELASEDELFRYPISKATTLKGVFADIYPDARYMGEQTRADEQNESGADHLFEFRSHEGKPFYVFTRDSGEVWIDVSRLEEGGRGGAIYAAVANYAYNTRGKFIGDPHGLSEAAVVRRTPAMLASALRFGTTQHLEAAPEQIHGDPEKGIAPLDWWGNDLAKTQALIHTHLATLQNQFPQIKDYRFDFRSQQFTDAAGNPVNVMQLVESARRNSDDAPGLSHSGAQAAREHGDGRGDIGASRAGEATLRRGVFLQSLVASESGQRPAILEQVLRGSRALVSRGGLNTLFSRTNQTPPPGGVSVSGIPKAEIAAAEAKLQQRRKFSGESMSDKLLRNALQKTGAAKVIKASADTVLEKLGGIVPESVKAGVVSDYGIPEAVTDRRDLMFAHIRRGLRQAEDVLSALGGLTRAESRVAYEWMNQRDGDPLLEQLPEDSRKVLQDLKGQVDAMGREAVRLGQLSADAYDRNAMAYLHRSYRKWDITEATDKEKSGRVKMKQILGEQYKGRGMNAGVPMGQIKNVAPGWWNRKTQQGKADKLVVGEKFLRFERRENRGEGTRILEGMEGTLQQGRLLEVAWLPANEPVPAKYGAWHQDPGIWEARDTKGDKVVMWRDFTKAELVQMGEIDEVKYAVAKTLHQMTHDLEIGRYLEWLAGNYGVPDAERLPAGAKIVEASTSMVQTFAPDTWVQVPETKVAGTAVPKFGKLAGAYIPGPIWNDLRQVTGKFQPFGKPYATILKAWKISKTALSPTVHLNNVMANFVMADWHDIRAGHLLAALDILVHPNEAANKEIVGRFEDNGGTQGMYALSEIQREQLAPIIEELMKEVDNASEFKMMAGTASALQAILSFDFKQARIALAGSRGMKLTEAAYRKALDLYQSEDTVFRLAAFIKAKQEGKTDAEAGKFARRSFLDYQINAPWINAMRQTVFPFIGFTYRAAPMLLKTATDKPWKLMKIGLYMGLLNALGSALAGGDDDKERKWLPDEKAGRVWGLVPKLVRMPWNYEAENKNGGKVKMPVFLDIRRFIPVGDVFDLGQTHAAVPILPVAIPGGPLAVLAELLANKSQFTGREIVKETDTAGETVGKVADHLYKAFAPNLIGLPGTYATDAVWNAGTGKTDVFGREQSLPMALSSSIGVKLGAYPTDVLQRNAVLEMKANMGEIERGLKSSAREHQRGGMSDGQWKEEIQRAEAKLKALGEKMRERAKP